MAYRIVFEPGSYAFHNHGDNAMMQVAFARLNEMWPDAEIAVVTSRPDKLQDHCPSAISIPESERRAWLSGRTVIGGFHHKLPIAVSTALSRVERDVWLRCPRVANMVRSIRTTVLRRNTVPSTLFYNRLARTDLLVVCGMGLINDSFEDSACALLDELYAASLMGVQVVAFGQGIGPITLPHLRSRAQEVLSRLMLIGLRESYKGVRLLESLGVPRDRIVVTGDDAIEIAYLGRSNSLGKMIGINLRLASYSQVGEELATRLHEPFKRAAAVLHSSLTPVPISFSEESSDVRAISKVLKNQTNTSQSPLDSLEDVIRVISDCRVVVTGSYHAGVFALAQGIPVVALVHSAYYEQKFLGLSNQFRGGCQIIDLRKPITCEEIQGSISRAWESAEAVREPLLTAAAEQIELSKAAYQFVHRKCDAEVNRRHRLETSYLSPFESRGDTNIYLERHE